MKDCVVVITLAALLSSQNLIEDPDVSMPDKVAARESQEKLLFGLLEHAQQSQPEQDEFFVPRVSLHKQFSEWSRSLYVNFYDRVPNFVDFVTWLADNPPPRDIPTRSIDVFICDFFLDTKEMQKARLQ